MEPVSVLAATIITFLVPYFQEAGKAFAEKVGEAAWEKCDSIYKSIKTYFQDKNSALEALEELKSNPSDEDNQAALRKQLKKYFESDKQFFENIQKITEDMKQLGINVSGSGAVATTGGTAAGEHGIAIAGNVEGGVHFNDK